MKIVHALLSKMKKNDTLSTEHLEKNKLRASLEDLCNKYLEGDSNILEFEALPKALPFIIEILEEPVFLEKYEFQQVSESIFQIRAKEINLI